MWLRDRKGYWLVSGLGCIAIGLFFVAHEKGQPETELGSVIGEHTGITSTSPTQENSSAQQMQRIDTAKPRSLAAGALANSPIADLPAMQATPFLDPDSGPNAFNQNNINRIPVNAGKYLDPTGDPLSLSENDARSIGQTSINVGEFLDPDRKPHEPSATNNGESGTTHSDVGHYLDPDAESPEALTVQPLVQKHVGSFLEAGY